MVTNSDLPLRQDDRPIEQQKSQTVTNEDKPPHPEDRPTDWHKEFERKLRLPRMPLDEISKLLKEVNNSEPDITLRAGGRRAEMVIRFPGLSQDMRRIVRDYMSSDDITIADAFKYILWRSPKSNKDTVDKDTVWSRLSNTATDAYQQTWHHFLELCYVGHFHPKADEILKKQCEELKAMFRKRSKGHPKISQAETESLLRRYKVLLARCNFIHRVAMEEASKARRVETIRRAIWERVRRRVHGTRGDAYIFDGRAFLRIRYGGGRAKLHQPDHWKPHQLAIALLSLERKDAYQTIEKKIALSDVRSPT